MWRSVRRLAASIPPKGLHAAKSEAAIPDVLVSFGNQADKLTFVSHPGVMAISKLLELGHITQYRAVLTQADVDAIAEYDAELAKKAQIAVDEQLAVNFKDLDYFDRPEYVEAFKKEKEILNQARREVLKAPKGHYEIPKCVKDYKLPQAPRSWRPEMSISPEAAEADPQLQLREELSDLVRMHMRDGKTAERISN